MTDKELKQLLKSAPPQQDEQFVQNVMNQLPQTTINWIPVWGIRLVTMIVALIALWALTKEPIVDIFYRFLSLLNQQPSWSVTLTGGFLLTIGTLFVCHNREII